MSSKLYLIHERFHSLQGEGQYSGINAFFIRTYGCPLRCKWCDAAGTWHPDFAPKDVDKLFAITLAQEAKACRPEFVVVTGGEPTIHDLTEIVNEMHAVQLPVHLETSGAFPIKGDFDWITVSPKREKPPLGINVELADEFKIIVDSPTAIAEMTAHLKEWSGQPIYLHLEWSQHDNKELQAAIVDAVKSHGGRYRAGIQLHKYFTADSFDKRSRPLVPLGGDVSRGY